MRPSDSSRRERRPLSYLNKKRRKVLERLLIPATVEEFDLLAENAILRNDLTLKKEDGLAYRLRIPYRHDQVIKQVIPELRETQPREARLKAFRWLLRDPISKPYRVKT